MRTTRLISLIAFLFVATAGAAHLRAAPGKPAAITVVMSDLGCSTALGADTFEARAWAWGAANISSSTGGSGGSVGKAVVNALSISRVSDACSPALLSGVVTGKPFKTLTLSQYDAAGVLKATVILNNAFLADWQIGGTNASAEATESVSVSFGKFVFTDAASGARVCYDVERQTPC